jgi:nitrogen fixation/metabolism regulation signal transduction histidine kinase
MSTLLHAYVTRAVLFETANRGTRAILQESLEEQLEPFKQLNRILLIIFLVAVVGSLFGAILVGRSVVSPVEVLEAGARQIAKGKFSHRVEIKQRDELVRLAKSFNQMR